MNEIISVTDDSFEISYLQDFMLYGGYQMIKRWVNEDCRIPPEKNDFDHRECLSEIIICFIIKLGEKSLWNTYGMLLQRLGQE